MLIRCKIFSGRKKGASRMEIEGEKRCKEDLNIAITLIEVN